jgi:hypothetical protein
VRQILLSGLVSHGVGRQDEKQTAGSTHGFIMIHNRREILKAPYLGQPSSTRLGCATTRYHDGLSFQDVSSRPRNGSPSMPCLPCHTEENACHRSTREGTERRKFQTLMMYSSTVQYSTHLIRNLVKVERWVY